jgi:hypothetical protein
MNVQVKVCSKKDYKKSFLHLTGLQGQLGRALKFGGLPVGTGFFCSIISGIIGKSSVLKEFDALDEVFTEVFEYRNVLHKFLYVNFKWDRVDTLTFNLVSRGSGYHTDHVEFPRSFSHWEHLPKFGGRHVAHICPYIIQCTDFMSIDIH